MITDRINPIGISDMGRLRNRQRYLRDPAYRQRLVQSVLEKAAAKETVNARDAAGITGVAGDWFRGLFGLSSNIHRDAEKRVRSQVTEDDILNTIAYQSGISKDRLKSYGSWDPYGAWQKYKPQRVSYKDLPESFFYKDFAGKVRFFDPSMDSYLGDRVKKQVIQGGNPYQQKLRKHFYSNYNRNNRERFMGSLQTSGKFTALDKLQQMRQASSGETVEDTPKSVYEQMFGLGGTAYSSNKLKTESEGFSHE